MLVRTGLFERFELAREQARRHEMLVTRGDAAGDERCVSLEINEADVRPVADQDVAVAPLGTPLCIFSTFAGG